MGVLGINDTSKRPEYRIEFGHYDGGKWVADTTFVYNTFEFAKSALQVISDEFVRDPKYPQFERTGVKLFSPKGHLYHYITPNFPRIALQSREVA